MVDIKDFGFIMDYALYDELPYYATGYISSDCENYIPPEGYVVLECTPSDAMIIGGTSRSDLKRVKVGLYSMVNQTSLIGVAGVAVIILAGIGIAYLHFKGKDKKRVTSFYR